MWVPETGGQGGQVADEVSRFAFVTCSDVGRVRTNNEDVVAVDADGGWALLADGMGGYRGGEVAARIAVDCVADALRLQYRVGWTAQEVESIIGAAIRNANAAVHSASIRDPDLAYMGSTIVAAVFTDDAVVVAHVGDSRLYRCRAGRLELLTRDHTVLQELIDDGMISAEEANQSGARGLLTRGLGVAPDVEADVGVYALLPDDLFLLCSDGLTDMLLESTIRGVLTSLKSPEEIAEALVEMANANGGRDNISVILARVRV